VGSYVCSFSSNIGGIWCWYRNNCNSKNSCVVKAVCPAALSVSVAGTNVTCNGRDNGSATALACGGCAPYTYSWTRETSEDDTAFNATPPTTATISSLVPGTYTVVVVDGASATVTASVTIEEPLVLAFTPVSGIVGSTITGTGGVSPYLYSFVGETSLSADDKVPDIATGTYQLLVVDRNGCTFTADFMITA